MSFHVVFKHIHTQTRAQKIVCSITNHLTPVNILPYHFYILKSNVFLHSQDILPVRGCLGQFPAQLSPAEPCHSLWREDLHDPVSLSGGQPCLFLNDWFFRGRFYSTDVCANLSPAAWSLHPACHHYQGHLHGLLLQRCEDLSSTLPEEPVRQWLLQNPWLVGKREREREFILFLLPQKSSNVSDG